MQLIPPTLESRDIKPVLAELAQDAISLRSVVPYHTLDANAISPQFAPLWTKPESFHCVHLHQNTDFPCLVALHSQGAKLYIMLRRLHDAPPGYEGLLHSKVYLFSYPNGQHKILIGSHNFTPYGIQGVNVESSVLITCTSSDPFYAQVKSFLAEVRAECEEFNLEDLDYYKQLARRRSPENASPVIFMYANSVANFEKRAITLFGGVHADFRELRNIGRKVYLRMLSLSDKKLEQSYVARISQSGYLKNFRTQRGGLQFSSRLHALKRTGAPATLEEKSQPDKQVIEECEFFVTLEVLKALPEGTIFRLPITSNGLWEPDTGILEVNRQNWPDSIPLVEKARPKSKIPAAIESSEMAAKVNRGLFQRRHIDLPPKRSRLGS